MSVSQIAFAALLFSCDLLVPNVHVKRVIFVEINYSLRICYLLITTPLTAETVDRCSRKELQSLCKERKLKANGKNEELKTLLKTWLANQTSTEQKMNGAPTVAEHQDCSTQPATDMDEASCVDERKNAIIENRKEQRLKLSRKLEHDRTVEYKKKAGSKTHELRQRFKETTRRPRKSDSTAQLRSIAEKFSNNKENETTNHPQSIKMKEAEVLLPAQPLLQGCDSLLHPQQDSKDMSTKNPLAREFKQIKLAGKKEKVDRYHKEAQKRRTGGLNARRNIVDASVECSDD